MSDSKRVKLDYWTAFIAKAREAKHDQMAIYIDEFAEILRLAKVGRDLEEGREVYVRGIRVHVPIMSEPGVPF